MCCGLLGYGVGGGKLRASFGGASLFPKLQQLLVRRLNAFKRLLYLCHQGVACNPQQGARRAQAARRRALTAAPGGVSHPGRRSIRAHVIALADDDAVVAQDGVGGGDVEEELWGAVVRQVGLTTQLFFFRRTGPQHDFLAFAAIEL